MEPEGAKSTTKMRPKIGPEKKNEKTRKRTTSKICVFGPGEGTIQQERNLKKKNRILQMDSILDRMQSERKLSLRSPTRLAGPQAGPRANSVACANGSARGPVVDSLPAKNCKKFGYLGSISKCLCRFRRRKTKKLRKESNFDEKVAKKA